MKELLTDGLKKLGISGYEEKSELLYKYVGELMLFNPALKLVGDRDERGIIIRHILDSASGYNVFLECTKIGDTIADLGSGSGLPGIVLASILEDRNFVLVERMQRRVGFLRGVVAKLKLQNVRVLDKDIRDIDEKFSAITCRAFHPLIDIAKDSVKLLDNDGVAIMYKGQRKSVDSELQCLSFDYDFNASCTALDVPFLNEERVMCVLSGWRKR